MSHLHLMRQLDIIPLEILSSPVTIIGAGAIGSFTGLALAKMGFSDIEVIDFDFVETENLNCQFYPMGAVKMPKVVALEQLVQSFTGTQIKTQATTFNCSHKPRAGIVICAVDSMQARKTIWEKHKDNRDTKWFIDPRMGAEYAQLYAMNPNDPRDQTSYEKTLYSDENSVQERCTAKATIYTALLLSGLVCKAVKDCLTKSKNYPRVVHWNIGDNHFQSWSKQSLGNLRPLEESQNALPG